MHAGQHRTVERPIELTRGMQIDPAPNVFEDAARWIRHQVRLAWQMHIALMYFVGVTALWMWNHYHVVIEPRTTAPASEHAAKR